MMYRLLTRIKTFSPSETPVAITLVTLTALTIILLGFSQPYFFLTDDNADQNLPNYVYNYRSVVQQHALPFINFHQFLGQTHLGQGQTAVLYPPVYLAVGLSNLLFGNYLHTMDILAIIHFAIAAVAIYILLRQLNISSIISSIVSLIWISYPYLLLNSKSVADRGFLAALLPLNWLFLEKLINRPTFKAALLLALVKMFIFFQGYVQHLFMIMQFELIYMSIFIIAAAIKQPLKTIVPASVAYFKSLLFTLLLIAPLLFSMWHTANLSNRQTVSLSDFVANPINLGTFFNAQLFHFTGNALHGASSHMFYLGPFVILTLFLVPLLAQPSSVYSRRAGTFTLLAIIALAIGTPYFYSLLYNIPLFNYFRWPHKYFSYVLFFSSLGLACTCQALSNQVKRHGRLAIYAFLVLSLVLNTLVTWQNKTSTLSFWPRSTPTHNDLSTYIDKYQGRIFTHLVDWRAQDIDQFYTYDYATLYDVFHFSGYDPLVSQLNANLTFNLPFKASWDGSLDQSVLDYLSTWSVRYIISTNLDTYRKTYFPRFPQLQLIHSTPGALLYENRQALPYARFADSPRQALPITFGVNRVDIITNNNTPQDLVVSLAPLSNYYYFIDGHKIGRVPTSAEPIKLNLPSATHQVTIKYFDLPFIYGSLISLSFLLFVTWRYRHYLHLPFCSAAKKPGQSQQGRIA